jgi:hypothetical protein
MSHGLPRPHLPCKVLFAGKRLSRRLRGGDHVLRRVMVATAHRSVLRPQASNHQPFPMGSGCPPVAGKGSVLLHTTFCLLPLPALTSCSALPTRIFHPADL